MVAAEYKKKGGGYKGGEGKKQKRFKEVGQKIGRPGSIEKVKKQRMLLVNIKKNMITILLV